MTTPRFAVISDIHANAFALEAVIASLAQRDVERVYVGGDLVGRGPQGEAVVRRVCELGWPSVRGNHEDYLVDFHRRRVPDAWWEDPAWSASRWMAEELSAESFDYLEALPFSLRPCEDPRMMLVHGTPRSNREGVGSWTPGSTLDAIVEGIEPGGLLLVAHTHRALCLEHRGVTVVNTGSVGLPFDGDARAQYVIISPQQQENAPPQVEFVKVEYDREALLTHYKKSGFLREGGVTSAMLYKEIVYARPFLVPYLRWAELTGEELDEESIARFLEFYDCELPMERVVARFNALKSS